MDGILSRFSGYQFLSSIIPGAVLLIFITHLDVDGFGKWTATEQVVGAYFSGLALNRLGALLAYWDIGKASIEKLYKTYRDDHLAQSVYDTYVMYRTFVVTLPCAGLALWAPTVNAGWALANRIFLSIAIVLLTALFIAAWRLQREYIGMLIDGGPHVSAGAPDDPVAPAEG